MTTSPESTRQALERLAARLWDTAEELRELRVADLTEAAEYVDKAATRVEKVVAEAKAGEVRDG